jgi:putative Mn2+ efflux pump MntP
VRRHDMDLVSLIAGVLFGIIALVHLVGAATDESVDPRWIAPVLLVGLGVAGLAGALRGARREQPEQPSDGG